VQATGASRETAAHVVRTGLRGQAAACRDLWITARPLHWHKNLLLFAALVFSLGDHWDPGDAGAWVSLLARAGAGFVLFSLVASGEYFVNDALDAERDRAHPRKRARPVAAGRVARRMALAIGAGLTASGVLLGFALDLEFGVVALGYAVLAAGYSVALKHLVVVDVIAVASGFALRAVAGAVVIDVPVSPWLYVVTTLGALFIAAAKRRQELVLLGRQAAGHRAVLGDYTVPFLDQMLSVAAAATIVAFALYATTAENLPRDHSMLLTLPFVLYGVFRYRLIAERAPERNADELVLRDVPLLASVGLFALTALAVLLVAR
jgi:4-hydroxybenzoate polyprenyltransferase